MHQALRILLLGRKEDKTETHVTRRTICMIDGENMVMRYQDMLKAGRTPQEENVHVPDTFIWHNCFFGQPVSRDVIRVDLYTSVAGDHDRVSAIRDQIQAQAYLCGDVRGITHWQRLRAIVFKKDGRTRKTKTVDVRIVLDALSHSMNRNIDALFLASGDGDFVPLIEEVMRHGIRVEVFALSSGLSPEMRQAGDSFNSLDDVLFKQEPRS